MVGGLLSHRHAIEEVLVGVAGADQPVHGLDAAAGCVGKHQRGPPSTVGPDVLKADAGLGEDQPGIVIVVRGLGVVGPEDRRQGHEAAVVEHRGINLDLVGHRPDIEVQGRRLGHQR